MYLDSDDFVRRLDKIKCSSSNSSNSTKTWVNVKSTPFHSIRWLHKIKSTYTFWSLLKGEKKSSQFDTPFSSVLSVAWNPAFHYYSRTWYDHGWGSLTYWSVVKCHWVKIFSGFPGLDIKLYFYARSPSTMRNADAVAPSTGVLATHLYTPWSPWLTLKIWRLPSSAKYLLTTLINKEALKWHSCGENF